MFSEETPTVDRRRSRVDAFVTIVGVGGKSISRGQPVDLNEVVGNGQRVRDVFPEDWFEAWVEPVNETPVSTADQAEPSDQE